MNHCRGVVKSVGGRVPGCSAQAFHGKAWQHLPAVLESAVGPILEMLEQITAQIRAYDRELQALAQARYQETETMRQVTGVGVVTSLTYALVIEDPSRFAKSRSVGAYVGLVPRRRDSGDNEPQLRITKRRQSAAASATRLVSGLYHGAPRPGL